MRSAEQTEVVVGIVAVPNWTLRGTYMYRRISLGFQVEVERLRARLPDGWRPAETRGWGNVTVAITETLAVQDASGADIPDGRRRCATVSSLAWRSGSDDEASWRYLTLGDQPDPLEEGWPELLGEVDHVERRHERRGGWIEQETRYEGEGGVVELEARYRPGPLARSIGESEVRCVEDPERRLRHRTDHLVDVVFSETHVAERLERCRYVLEIRGLRDVLNGSERLVSVAVVPWAIREVEELVGSG